MLGSQASTPGASDEVGAGGKASGLSQLLDDHLSDGKDGKVLPTVGCSARSCRRSTPAGSLPAPRPPRPPRPRAANAGASTILASMSARRDSTWLRRCRSSAFSPSARRSSVAVASVASCCADWLIGRCCSMRSIFFWCPLSMPMAEANSSRSACFIESRYSASSYPLFLHASAYSSQSMARNNAQTASMPRGMSVRADHGHALAWCASLEVAARGFRANE